MASIEGDSMDEKTTCKLKLQKQLLPTFPLPRFCYFGHYRAYYPFGNTPAEDFLESCAAVSQPSVLFLGCGDMRSVFYTLWKNFDKALAKPLRFEGVNFTLNDYSAAVMARNIILLHMCLHLPEQATERRNWLGAMWAIWYCHELYPCHLDILNHTLKSLLMYSDSINEWSNKENPLHSLVRFTSSASLTEIADMWSYWLNKAKTVSKQKMQQSRYKLLDEMINDISEHSINLSKGHTLVFGESEHATLNKALARAHEVKNYLVTGSCYAEVGFSMKLPSGETKLNTTMYERKDGIYTCHYGLVPFECYYHTVDFKPSKNLNIPYEVIVPSDSFKSNPFLANSLQQFCMIVQSAHQIMTDPNIKLFLAFDVQDALKLCQQQIQCNNLEFEQESKTVTSCPTYDVINTSNLMDHLNPLNVILACTPLLKEDGILMTLSLCCRGCSNTGEEYLSLLFGFSTELFPVILGIRCISHEGSKYSNTIKIDPSLPDISHYLKCLPHIRIFHWVKESDFQKLVFAKLPKIEEGNVTDALANLLGSCMFSLLNYGPGESINMLSRNSIETALAVLNRVCYISGNFKLSPVFWGPLCNVVRQFGGPFLHNLQTHCLLHDIHVHLTLSETDCPFCQRTPLNQTLGLFCIRISKELIRYGTPFFTCFIHRCSNTDSEFLKNEAIKGGDVHIFDCFDDSLSNSNLELKFFAPLSFAKSYYNATLTFIHRTRKTNILNTIESVKLQDVQVPWVQYFFHQCEKPINPALLSAFGTVSSHICDSYKSETEIVLSQKVKSFLPSSKFETHKTSNRKVSICCKDLVFDLQLCYPVEYNSIKITLCKQNEAVMITCLRKPYSVEDERPCCTVTPDHHLSILKSKVEFSLIPEHSGMQVTATEAELYENFATSHLCSLDTKVKALLRCLLEGALKYSLFTLRSKDMTARCLVVINQVLFDYQHKTPALDLAYCFLDTHNSSAIMEKWYHGVDLETMRFLRLEQDGYGILNSVFKYFTLRTNGTLKSAGSNSKFSQLNRLSLNDSFTRAVVYLLLRDPDKAWYAVGDYFGLTTLNTLPKVGGVSCNWCKKLTFTAKRCGRCSATSYCSKRCQTSHWPEHKYVCNNLLKCTCCKSSVEKARVKKPSCQCKDVAYCSINCLQRDKSQHSKVCATDSQKKIVKTSQSSIASDSTLCDHCGIQSNSSMKCSHCTSAENCSTVSLIDHWPPHKVACGESTETGVDQILENDKAFSQLTTIGATACPTKAHQESSLNHQRCSYCTKTSSKLKRCLKCHTVQYCNQDCQRRHWKDHKKTCKQEAAVLSASSSPVQKCTYCTNTILNAAVKCKDCGIVQYCSQECQEKHRLEHQVLCKVHNISQAPSCASCGSTSGKLFTCKRCNKVKYCGSKCQADHWKKHKLVCSTCVE